MDGYRAYIMGDDGHVQNRVDLKCNNEAEARRLALQLVNRHQVELWQLGRKLETFSPTAQGVHITPKPHD